jgi:uncharacterized protein (PEP-CTERM system associated)
MQRQLSGALAPALALALAAGAQVPAHAQAQETRGRTFEVTPNVSLGQTVTDNQVDGTNPSGAAESITTLQAGVRVASRTGRITGNVDYSLTGVMYARDSRSNDLQNRLQANVLGELVERRLFVEALASISQQPISALAQQTADGVVRTRNRTEVSTLALRPRLESRLGSDIDLQMQAALSATDTGGAAATSDSTNLSGSFKLASATGGKFGWSLDGTRNYVDFDEGRRTVDDRLTLGLSLRTDVDWLFRLRGGMEANNFRRTEGKSQYETWGAGFLWTPSARTRFSVDADRRAFGHSHTISLEHRSRQSVWRYSDSQDVTRGAADTAASLVGAFDLFNQLYASQEPDPVLREQLVDNLLQRNNLQRDSQVPVGFLTSAVTLQRRQELSLLLQGQRTSVIASAFASDSRRVDTQSSAVDDTVAGNDVRQRGLTFTLSHRLTPSASLSVLASGTRGQESAGRRTDLRSVSAFWSERLGPRTNFSLGVRHAEYEADIDPYIENAVIANLSLRF